jgi:hypothetical protein
MPNDRIGGVRKTLPMDLAAPYVPVNRHDRGPGIARMLQVYLPEVYPIPSAIEFNTQVSKDTNVVETADIGLTVNIPESNVGIVRAVLLQINDMLTTTNVTWTLQFNGAPVPGYSKISMFPRSAPFVGNSFDAFVRVPSGTKITVQYDNVDGGSYKVGAAVSGWFWPESLGQLWLQQGP